MFKKVLVANADGVSGGGDWSACAAFSADSKTLFGATSGKLLVWDISSGKKLKEMPFRAKDKGLDIRHVAFSDDGRVAATQGEQKVHVWDTATGAGNILSISSRARVSSKPVSMSMSESPTWKRKGGGSSDVVLGAMELVGVSQIGVLDPPPLPHCPSEPGKPNGDKRRRRRQLFRTHRDMMGFPAARVAHTSKSDTVAGARTAPIVLRCAPQ